MREIIQSDINSAIRGLNMLHRSRGELQHLADHHDKVDMFASKVIALAAKLVLTTRDK